MIYRLSLPIRNQLLPQTRLWLERVNIRVRGHEVQDANMLFNVRRTQRSTRDGSWEMALGTTLSMPLNPFHYVCVCVCRVLTLTVNSVDFKTATDSTMI